MQYTYNKKMKIYLKRVLKRLCVKFTLWHKYRFFTEKSRLSENEKICTAICRRLINHPDSKFLIAPLSGKKYIKNVVLGLFILMDDRKISITNHVYHYDVVLCQRDWEKLNVLYDNKTEIMRQGYEDEIKSQIVHSLSSILEKIA